MHPTLTALLSLLTTAVTDLDKLYELNNISFPSLDEPSSQSEILLRDDPEGQKASRTILAVCDQLMNLVQTPEDILRQESLAFARTTCLQTVIEANIPEILAEFGGEQGLHIDRIASICGANASKLGRVLRYLATFHIFRETSPDVFANNRTSYALNTGRPIAELIKPSDKYVGAAGQISALCLHDADPMMQVALDMSKVIRRPNEPYSQAPFNKFAGSDMGFYSWLQLPGNEEKFSRFNFAMGLTRSDKALFGGFQWDSLKPGAQVIDVGGGMGFATLAISKEFPDLKYIIQDLPAVVDASKEYWTREAPQAIASNTVTHQAHNFFEEQPIQGADVYFLRGIIHNWPDEAAIQILSKLRAVASDSTKLICVEKIVDHACPASSLPDWNELGVPDKEAEFAPSPLLSNWGAGSEWVFNLDMLIMLLFGDAKERTVLQWKHVYEQAGWKLSQIHRGVLAQYIGEPI